MRAFFSHRKISYQKIILLVAGIMTVFLMLVLPNPISPILARDQGQTDPPNPANTSILQKVEPCSVIGGAISGSLFSFECIAKGLANLSQGILSAAGWILIFAARIFDTVKDIALDAKTYNSIDVVKTGWTSVRNVANIFFIFILLFIAIATILRMETYGVKQLLLRFIIIALFINFSYTITLYIILPANSLAEFFVTNTLNNPDFAQYKDSRSMVEPFIDGLKPAVYFKQNPNFLHTEIETYNDIQKEIKAQDTPKNKLQTALYVLAATILGIILILFTSFILLMAGFLLLARIAVLWILMIFSPMAFLFMILPKTQGIASEWWNKLINQALFPAAFLFLFSIVISIGASNQVREFIFNVQKDNEGANIINFIAIYIILLILLYLSLDIARRMGAYGATTAMGWAGSLQKFATGAMIGAGAYVGYKTAGKAARTAESLIGEERKAQLETMPWYKGGVFTRPVAKGLEKLGAMGKREETEKERVENLKKLSPDMLTDRFFRSTYAEQTKALQDKEIAKRLGQAQEKMTPDNQARYAAAISRQSYQTQSQLYQAAPKLFAKARNELRKEVRNDVLASADKTTLQKIANATPEDQRKSLLEETAAIDKQQARDIASVIPHVVALLSKNIQTDMKMDLAEAIRKTDFENIQIKSLNALGKIEIKDEKGALVETMEHNLAKYTTPSQRQKILTEGGANSEVYLNQVHNLIGPAGTPEDFARKLESAGNRVTANKVRGKDRLFLGLHNPAWFSKPTRTGGGGGDPFAGHFTP